MKIQIKILIGLAVILLIGVIFLFIFVSQNKAEAETEQVLFEQEILTENSCAGGVQSLGITIPWPTATIKLCSGSYSNIVSSGSYTNRMFGAVTTNASSLELKEVNGSANRYDVPNSQIMFSRQANGWYYMTAYPVLGYASEEVKIGLDTVKPILTIYSNGKAVSSGSTTGVNVYAAATDEFSGISTIWVLKPGASSYVAHYGGALTAGGTYYFYATDRAGNSSATQTVTLDKTAPSIQFFGSTKELYNNSYTNAEYLQILASDSQTGLDAIYVKQPGASIYVAYTQGSVQFTNEGIYSFYAKDKGGNSTMTYTVTIDRTKPAVTVQYQGTSVGNGAVINRTGINVYCTDALSPYTIYYKQGSSSTVYTAGYGASFSSENTYIFWAVDSAGNKSEEYTVTLDRTAPGYTLYAGNSATTASYTNAASIRYTASDKNSFTVYVKEPGKTAFVSAENSKTYTAEGVYYFYAIDAAGNQSATRSIWVDRTKPQVNLWDEHYDITDSVYSNAEYIYLTVHDAGSGVNTIHAKLPGASMFSAYSTPGNKHDSEGTYTFYCVDFAGNVSEIKTIHLDRTKPEGRIYSEGTESANGKNINTSFYYSVSDDFTGIERIELKRPGSSIWESYENGMVISGADGKYTFRAYDFAGNVSAESYIIYDITLPTVSAEAYQNLLLNNSYTNAESIMFSVNDVNPVTSYIKLPGASNFTQADAGVEYSSEGRYEFYSRDAAGNQSPVYVVTIDRQKPIGILASNGTTVTSGSYVNVPFKFKASDDVSGIAGYELKRPNGDWEGYSGNAEITGIDGWYSFRAYDIAGNVSEIYKIYYDTGEPVIQCFADGDEIGSGTYINAEQIYFTVTDISIDKLYIKFPGTDNFVLAVENGIYSSAGRYEYYAVDSAGNQSDIFILTVDRVNPTGEIIANGTALYNGAVINTPFSFTANDNFGIDRLEYKMPDGDWELYNGTEIRGTSDGRYMFRAVDLAGNYSAEYYIIYDTTVPVVAIYSGNDILSDGRFTNTDRLRFEPSDLNLKAGYIKLPDAESFIECIPGLTFSAAGHYKYYAVDYAGNVSEIYSITVDKSIPIGYLYSEGSLILSGSYINTTFIFTASNEISGIVYLEIKRPYGGWEMYTEGTAISGMNGTYAFRALSSAGNYSVESIVYYDTTAPEIKIFAGENEVESGSETGAAYICFTADDMNLNACYIKLAGESGFKAASSGLQYTQSGLYEFYAEDKAGNRSGIFTVMLDRIGPSGMILIDGEPAESGTYTNKAFEYIGSGGLTQVVYYEIKLPGAEEFKEYILGTRITPDSANGRYIFRCYDTVGNVSAQSVVYLDSVSPVGKLYANEQPVESGAFTNALRIKFEGADENAVTCFVKLPGASGYIQTASGAVYSDEGVYEYYVTDIAGNKSGIYIITIDRTPKSAQLSNVKDSIAEKNVTVSWTDNNGAAIVSVTVNDISVSSGSVIKIIGGGVYEVKTIDEAGNVWVSSFRAVTADVLTATSNQYWWEYKAADGTVLAFETYEAALAYGTLDELSLVKTSVWNNDEWDAGYIMDSVDSVNAKPGTFYIYKKWDDPKTEVAYFTNARLNAVAKLYAEIHIATCYYYEKTPAISAEENVLYSLSENNIVIAKSVSLNVNARYLLNGEAFSEDKITKAGRHTLTVYDDFGNSYDFTVYIVTETPEFYFRDANGDYYLASNDQPYYLKNRFTIKLTDTLDEYAMALVLDSGGNVLHRLNEGEEYIVSETGKYVIRTINHFGQTDYVFYISASLPEISITENKSDKRLNVTVTPSGDRDIYLTLIQIEYSADGEAWEELTADHYNNTISPDRLSYNFYLTGRYRVTIEDTCRSGIDKLVSEVYYDKPAPEGKFTGLCENSYTNQNVTFTWTDEAYATLEYNGEKVDYLSGSVIDAGGKYVLAFYDYNGYMIEYCFTIDKQAPEAMVSADITSGYATESLSIIWDDTDVTAALYLNSDFVGTYESGDIISIDGSYTLKLIDLAGNEAIITFILDTTAPVLTLTGVENGGSTKGIVKLNGLTEEATLKVFLNDREISYRLGENLTELGSYRVVLTDLAGNITEYTFEILYSYNAGSIVVIVLAVLLVGGGAAAIIIMRRRKRFKTKK